MKELNIDACGGCSCAGVRLRRCGEYVGVTREDGLAFVFRSVANGT